MTTPVRHLLVTNDFPPKIGGIQSVLWESWRRLDPDSFAVLTSPHPDAAAFDAEQPFRVERVREFALLPHPVMVRRIRRLAAEFGAQRVVLDPVFPLGLVGLRLGLPYDVVVHGAELTIPGRLPVTSHLIRSVLTGARRVIAFGTYPAAVSRAVARADLDVAIINPGVDTDRFRPLDPAGRAAARARLGLDPSAHVVLGISRLVRRKGFDTALAAVGRLAPDFKRKNRSRRIFFRLTRAEPDYRIGASCIQMFACARVCSRFVPVGAWTKKSEQFQEVMPRAAPPP